ncbi:MAG TPA: DNA-directed RNA polymerase subunit beta [Elusimicrobia bacterium]|nr:DNA-directed RNA polymerase subunit beta [Elusimicrobiota bacterium]
MKRISFAKFSPVIKLPDLIEVQKDSFVEFLQANIPPEKRKLQGLQASFLDVFPIASTNGEYILEFVSYELAKPKFTEEEALLTDSNYAAPLKATFRLLAKQEKGAPKEISEQDVYVCDLPLMTKKATFIINGVERVVVTQMHRSPGVIFEEDEETPISIYGKHLFFARIIPYRGAWVEFEYDDKNILWVRIDKKKKFLATTLLRAIGIEKDSDILKFFYKKENIPLSEAAVGRILAEDIVDTKTGEVLAETNRRITEDLLTLLRANASGKIKSVAVIITEIPAGESVVKDMTISETLALDKVKTRNDAIMYIYRQNRAMEYVKPDQAVEYFENLILKNPKKYDLSKVGRFKINRKFKKIFEKLGFEIPKETKKTLTVEDIVATMKYMIDLNNGLGSADDRQIDDIDHLGNRRIRAVGELLENQMRIGLAHMVRLTREKMNSLERAQATPRNILNTQPVIGIIKKFFGTGQLSQYMDQINPLAELTHKRRLSALGPGGLHRKRAGFEVRDVHYTHYGRICPIETPEGANIGLITSLACYSRVNEYGLLETPYRKVVKGRVTDEIEYMTADKEDALVIAQANSPIDKSGKFITNSVSSRHGGEFIFVAPDKIDYMDISPLQVVSTSAALIPFLEHDDANRALMGSNMMRQSVPLISPEQPVVATGIEDNIAVDTGAVVVSEKSGEVLSVDSRQIAIKDKETGVIDVYKLKKFERSNQDTCINQAPIVKKGDSVKKGQAIADGASTKDGSLALGRNILVAFMSWEGYNYEDAILVSEKLVREDMLTSIHIQEFVAESRDTKMGPEEITKDIPNVSKDAMLNLDENGVITVGSNVEPGDILVGKITPKGDQQTTPEERLLRVIFGKKSEEAKDVSLRVPPGVYGKVSDVKIFERKEKLSREEMKKRVKEIEAKYKKESENAKTVYDETVKSVRSQKSKKEELLKAKELFKKQQEEIKKAERFEKDALKTGDELPISVNKIVKVYIATTRKIQVGDKISGRHGNKGVVAKILPAEDMPYLPDGTPVDMIISPLSVPSRMNVGQILEMMLGWAGIQMNEQAICPVFNSAKEQEVKQQIALAKKHLISKGVRKDFLPDDSCRITLYDGRTGVPFSEKITIGYMYIMKLAHLVDDKMHARSTGPYSLITRQPLGGKAHGGGQRMGEMEIWAIEGYGAAHTMQEFLTIKSDDVAGRTKMYEAIINGKPITQMGVPESFKVLVKELQSLGLNIELLK